MKETSLKMPFCPCDAKVYAPQFNVNGETVGKWCKKCPEAASPLVVNVTRQRNKEVKHTFIVSEQGVRRHVEYVIELECQREQSKQRKTVPVPRITKEAVTYLTANIHFFIEHFYTKLSSNDTKQIMDSLTVERERVTSNLGDSVLLYLYTSCLDNISERKLNTVLIVRLVDYFVTQLTHTALVYMRQMRNKQLTWKHIAFHLQQGIHLGFGTLQIDRTYITNALESTRP